MEINLEPRYEQMLDSLVESGRFASAEDAVSAALEVISLQDDEPLDEETLAKIAVGEAQLDRGEYVEYDLSDGDKFIELVEARARKSRAERRGMPAR